MNNLNYIIHQSCIYAPNVQKVNTLKAILHKFSYAQQVVGTLSTPRTQLYWDFKFDLLNQSQGSQSTNRYTHMYMYIFSFRFGQNNTF